MSFDSLSLRTIISELNSEILNGQIRHVEQINPFEIILKISQNGENRFLLMSSHAEYFRTHLIDRMPKSEKNKDSSFRFATVLNKYLRYGKISKIEQFGYDRIIKIWIHPGKSIVEKNSLILIGEFMGKHSNIILIENSDNIIESIKHIDETISRYRQVLPGLKYELPPQQDKIEPYEINEEILKEIIEKSNKSLWKTLLYNIDGLSPILSKEIVVRAESEQPEAIWSAFEEIRKYFDPRNKKPQVLIEKDSNKVILPSIMPLYQFPEKDSLKFDKLSEALEYYYHKVISQKEKRNLKDTLLNALERQRSNIDEKLVELSKKLEKAENADKYRIIGELLTANLYRIERGQTEVEVENYYEPDSKKITIELDPQISPSANAQKQFKLYNKAKRSRNIITKLIAENEDSLRLVSEYEMRVENADTISELQKAREEMEKLNWIKSKQKPKKGGNKEQSAFLKFESPDGFQVYVGRNSKENDQIIRTIATKHDMWLHAKQMPGSHVLVRNPERKPGIPMPTLLFSAKTAAYFSKGKHSTAVPVDYTWAKYVVKPKGSNPGFVTYTHEKTLYVKPDKPVITEDL